MTSRPCLDEKLKSCIGMRCDLSQFFLHVLRYIQCLNEIFDSLLADSLVRSCQSLQCLVRMWIGLTT